MGLNICITTLDHEDHPDWDFAKHEGDRDLPDMLWGLPKTHAEGNDEYIRPTDFTIWRARLERYDSPNRDRFSQMLDILENDTNYWIYLSW